MGDRSPGRARGPEWPSQPLTADLLREAMEKLKPLEVPLPFGGRLLSKPEYDFWAEKLTRGSDHD